MLKLMFPHILYMENIIKHGATVYMLKIKQLRRILSV